MKMLEKLDKSEADEGYKAMDACRRYGSNFHAAVKKFSAGHTTMKYFQIKLMIAKMHTSCIGAEKSKHQMPIGVY